MLLVNLLDSLFKHLDGFIQEQPIYMFHFFSHRSNGYLCCCF